MKLTSFSSCINWKTYGLIFFSLTPFLQYSISRCSWISSHLKLSKQEDKQIHYLLSSFLPWGLGSRHGAFNSSRRGNHFCVPGQSQTGENEKPPRTMIPKPWKLSSDNCLNLPWTGKTFGTFIWATSQIWCWMLCQLQTLCLCSQTRPCPTSHISSYFILLTQATASIVLSLSFHSLFLEDLISSMKTGFPKPPPKPTGGYREQGSNRPRAHWFILHCNSDMWYRCSYAWGVPVLAMAYLDIVEAPLKYLLFPKKFVCLASRTDNGFVLRGGMGNSPSCYKTRQKTESKSIFWLPDTILYLTNHVRLYYLNGF